MKTDIKDLPKSQKEVKVEISVEEMEKYVQKSTEEISKQIKIDGFRPGKAPAEIVKQHIGEAGIYQEAGDLAVRETYARLIKENKIEAIGRPNIQITKCAPGNPLEYKAVFTVLPEIELSDYGKIRGKLEKKKIEIKQVENELEKLRKYRAKFFTTREPSQKGDRLEIDFESALDSIKIENGGGKKHPLIVGESNFVPGFDDNLIGLKEGEEKKFSVIFPEKHQKKELSGKKVDFEVKVHLVQKVELPKLDDELAKTIGKFKDLNDLKEKIKEGLEKDEEHRARGELREKIVGQIIKDSKMDVPELLLEEELDVMLKEFENSIERTGVKFDEYLKKLKATKEDIRRGWRGNAEDRVKLNLIIYEINKKEKVKIDEKDLKARTEQMLKTYTGVKEVEGKINPEAIREYLKETMIKEKVFEILENIALSK